MGYDTYFPKNVGVQHIFPKKSPSIFFIFVIFTNYHFNTYLTPSLESDFKCSETGKIRTQILSQIFLYLHKILLSPFDWEYVVPLILFKFYLSPLACAYSDAYLLRNASIFGIPYIWHHEGEMDVGALHFFNFNGSQKVKNCLFRVFLKSSSSSSSSSSRIGSFCCCFGNLGEEIQLNLQYIVMYLDSP